METAESAKREASEAADVGSGVGDKKPPAAENSSEDESELDMEDQGSTSAQEDTPAPDRGERPLRLQQRWTTVTARRGRYNPKPRTPPDDRRRENLSQAQPALPGKGGGTV